MLTTGESRARINLNNLLGDSKEFTFPSFSSASSFDDIVPVEDVRAMLPAIEKRFHFPQTRLFVHENRECSLMRITDVVVAVYPYR